MKSFDLITPEGTRDLLFDECIVRRKEEQKLRDIFTSHGYSEVITPALEFYDVFNMKARSFRQEIMYKLIDSKGRLMVIRPDSTMPIARIVATRLKNEERPLKLFYAQNIYRANPKMAGRDDEITQSGIEIIGGEEKRSDLEALSLAAKVLNSCASSEVRLEIGDNSFYKHLLNKLSLTDDEEIIRSLIESKNRPELKRYLDNVGADGEYARMLLDLSGLFGGEEVFSKAEKLFAGTPLTDRLNHLKKLYDVLCELEDKDRITVDLGLVNKAEYYTGIIFRGYIGEYGQPIISGGRYDTLIGSFGAENQPAVGFAANINAMTNVALKNGEKAKNNNIDVLVFARDGYLSQGIKHCKQLIDSGLKAEFCTCENEEKAKSYATAKNIKKLVIVAENTEEIDFIGGQNK